MRFLLIKLDHILIENVIAEISKKIWGCPTGAQKRKNWVCHQGAGPASTVMKLFRHCMFLRVPWVVKWKYCKSQSARAAVPVFYLKVPEVGFVYECGALACSCNFEKE